MRKKLVATLLVGAVAASSVIGLTACGGLSVNGGAEVADAAAWKAAFTASLGAENYTLDAYNYSEESSSSLNGKDVRVNYEEKNEITAKTCYDKAGNKLYTENYTSGNYKRVVDGEEEKEGGTSKLQTYTELGDKVDWVATYTYLEASGTTGKTTTESYWSARQSIGGSISISSMVTVSVLAAMYTTTEDSILFKPLSELYDSFTYEGGFYTAKLWHYAEEVTVTVAIKDGYVVGYQTEAVVDEKDGEDYEKSTEKCVYNFSNYGTTSVKAPGDATKAIEKAKKDAE